MCSLIYFCSYILGFLLTQTLNTKCFALSPKWSKTSLKSSALLYIRAVYCNVRNKSHRLSHCKASNNSCNKKVELLKWLKWSIQHDVHFHSSNSISTTAVLSSLLKQKHCFHSLIIISRVFYCGHTLNTSCRCFKLKACWGPCEINVFNNEIQHKAHHTLMKIIVKDIKAICNIFRKRKHSKMINDDYKNSIS